MKAIVILQRDLARMSYNSGNKLSNVRSFIILQSGEGLTVNNRANFANFFGKKKTSIKAFRGLFYLRTRAKTFSEISYSFSFLSSNLKLSIVTTFSRDYVLIFSDFVTKTQSRTDESQFVFVHTKAKFNNCFMIHSKYF